MIHTNLLAQDMRHKTRRKDNEKATARKAIVTLFFIVALLTQGTRTVCEFLGGEYEEAFIAASISHDWCGYYQGLPR